MCRYKTTRGEFFWATKKSLTSAWRPSTSSTKKTSPRRPTALELRRDTAAAAAVVVTVVVAAAFMPAGAAALTPAGADVLMPVGADVLMRADAAVLVTVAAVPVVVEAASEAAGAAAFGSGLLVLGVLPAWGPAGNGIRTLGGGSLSVTEASVVQVPITEPPVERVSRRADRRERERQRLARKRLELKWLSGRHRTKANAVLAEGVILQSNFLHPFSETAVNAIYSLRSRRLL